MQAVEVLFIVVPNLVCLIERCVEFLHRIGIIDLEPDFLRREISIVAAVDVNAGIFDVPLLNFRANIVVQTVRNQIRNGFEIFGISRISVNASLWELRTASAARSVK